MAKGKTVEQVDKLTGEINDVELDQVSYEEIEEALASARAEDTSKTFEWPDPRPMAPPLGWTPEIPLQDKIRAMVRSEHLRLAAIAGGMESFEEAEDFDVGDDFDPSSPYELYFDPPVMSPEASGKPVQHAPESPPEGGPSGGRKTPEAEPQAPADPKQ